MSSTLISFSILLDNSSPVVDPVRSSLEAREGLWFTCLLIASAGVAIGCVLEIPETWADLKEWKSLRKDTTTPNPSWRVPMAAIGLLLVVLGVIGEGVFEGLVSINETNLRAHDERVLGDTIKQAGAAKDSADAASIAAAKAKEASDKAIGSSGTALDTATEARKEADSFESEIVEAKKQAADAVSRLAVAEQQLADATQKEADAAQRELAAEIELNRLKTPRSLSGVNGLKVAIDPFKGTQYTLMTFADQESINLTKEIGNALDAAGWVRKEPTVHTIGGVSYFNVFSDKANDSVPSCIEIGVNVHVLSQVPVDILQSTPARNLPKEVQAAGVLHAALIPSIAPSDKNNVGGIIEVDRDKNPVTGEGPVLICVGKKP